METKTTTFTLCCYLDANYELLS